MTRYMVFMGIMGNRRKLYPNEWKAFIKEKYGTAPSVIYFDSPVIVDNLVGEIIMDDQQMNSIK